MTVADVAQPLLTEDCPLCEGLGYWSWQGEMNRVTAPCRTCSGKGWIPRVPEVVEQDREDV